VCLEEGYNGWDMQNAYGDEKCIQNFGWNAGRKDHSEGLSVDGKIILILISGSQCVRMLIEFL
jgi:hypothetical protein